MPGGKLGPDVYDLRLYERGSTYQEETGSRRVADISTLQGSNQLYIG